MKKLSTISLFIFWAIVTAILTAGLILHQNNKQSSSNATPLEIKVANGTVLNLTEISKHNIQTDCWMLIGGKVYDISSYFGKHPGGSQSMISSCGKDATAAYETKDPNAKTAGNSNAHSSRAVSLLSNYYIGDLNQTVNSSNTNSKTPSLPSSNNRGERGFDD